LVEAFGGQAYVNGDDLPTFASKTFLFLTATLPNHNAANLLETHLAKISSDDMGDFEGDYSIENSQLILQNIWLTPLADKLRELLALLGEVGATDVQISFSEVKQG
jgi:hypothetical protein